MVVYILCMMLLWHYVVFSDKPNRRVKISSPAQEGDREQDRKDDRSDKDKVSGVLGLLFVFCCSSVEYAVGDHANKQQFVVDN